MKTITLSHYDKPYKSTRTATRFYWVYLNGKQFKFSNEQKTKAFLSDHSKRLTSALFDLNILYAHLFLFARETWIRGDLYGVNDFSQSFTNYQSAIDFHFLQIYKNQRSINYNSSVYKNFAGILLNLINLANEIKAINIKGMINGETNRRLRLIITQLETYHLLLEC